jgi:ATP-dependent exoDNAse (exonuclease V) beta subunit
VDVQQVLRDAGQWRPPGRRFGTLVHDLLALVPFDAPPEVVSALATVRARVHGADDTERDAACAVVVAALAHPLMRRAATAARAGQARREWPVMYRAADGRLLEGQLDLAFEEDAGWTVVDFKTDADLDSGLDRYRQQVSLYAAALARVTGRQVTATVLQM